MYDNEATDTSKCVHLQSRRTKIYSNNSVYTPSGILLFRCSDRKIKWYVERGLAEVIPADLYHVNVTTSEAVRLLFEPKGTGRNRPGDAWYLEDQSDRCVVCGHENRLSRSDDEDSDTEEDVRGLTLHHVVPYQYRREMPVSYKSHASHDVLVLCVACHECYERHADAEKTKLSMRYDAPLMGRGWIKHPRHGSVRASAIALLRYRNRMPPERVQQLQDALVDFYKLSGPEDLTESLLHHSVELKPIEKPEDFQEHGELVIKAIEKMEGEVGFAKFVRFWRQHFLDSMQPQFLSKQWKVDDPVNLTAGEYNPFRPEMDGA